MDRFEYVSAAQAAAEDRLVAEAEAASQGSAETGAVETEGTAGRPMEVAWPGGLAGHEAKEGGREAGS